MMSKDASGPLVIDRESLGRLVRDAWRKWACTQPDPKPSWLTPYDELSEPDKEADRQIGEAICRLTMLSIAATNGSPVFDRPTDAKGMDPKQAAEWIVKKRYDDSGEAPFDGMDDESILAMFYPLAKAYLAKVR